MRIDLLTPLPPAPTGIADYAVELIPALAGRVNLTVYSDAPPDRDLGAAWAPIAAYRPRPGVIPLYQIGNSPAHESIYRIAVRESGITVLHDTVLHHFLSAITEARGDDTAYVRELIASHGSARPARRVLRGDGDAMADRFPLIGRIVDASFGMIVHSEDAADRVRAVRPAADPIVVPHLVAPPPAIDRQTARQRLGLPAGLLAGSFGLATPEKQIQVLFDALLLADNWRAVIVGEDAGMLAVPEALRNRVIVTGRVPWDDFRAYLAAVDVAVALRWPVRGETSGATLRALAAGTPVIASDAGSFRDLPASLVPLDAEAVAAALARFADAKVRAAEGARSAAWARANLAPDIVAGQYLAAIETILERLP